MNRSRWVAIVPAIVVAVFAYGYMDWRITGGPVTAYIVHRCTDNYSPIPGAILTNGQKGSLIGHHTDLTRPSVAAFCRAAHRADALNLTAWVNSSFVAHYQQEIDAQQKAGDRLERAMHESRINCEKAAKHAAGTKQVTTRPGVANP